jgi:undecaprenyl-diphosphatase
MVALASQLLRADAVIATAFNKLARAHQPTGALVSAAARWLAWVEVALMIGLAASGRRQAAMRMSAAVSLVYAASEALGCLWPRGRPFSELAGVKALVPHTAVRSFPSRHVASGLAMAAIGQRAHPSVGALMSGVAWLLGVSRVAAGLHYPTDVLAGVLLGTSVGRLLRE